MKLGRITAAGELEGVAYAAGQVVAFEDALADSLEAAGVVDIVPEAASFVEHSANLATRGLE